MNQSVIVSIASIAAILLILPINAYAVPGTGTLFANIARDALYTVDTSTAAFTLVGDTGFFRTKSLAHDHSTGILYAGTASGDLISLDKTTGAGTLIGDNNLRLNGLAISSDGTLYAAALGNLYTLDKTNGTPSLIGPLGASGQMEGLAFDESGTLYGSTNLGGFYIIDTSTGAATFIGFVIDQNSDFRRVVSLQFACDGTLYGGTRDGTVASGSSNSQLVTIDPTTVSAVILGNTGSINSLGGLAFDEPCTTPTEQIEDLSDTVVSLGLQQGIENALLSKLYAALAYLENGNDQDAVDVLTAFINQLNAQSGKMIPAQDAEDMILAAQQIIDSIQQS